MSAEMGMLVAPIQHIEQIDLSDANRALTAWDHKMGACRRPYGNLWAHGLFMRGELMAVTITSALINETCANLTRSQAIELARLCAARDGLCRIALRLWQAAIFPAYGRDWGVSYQDETLHTGAIYRFNGWRIIGRSRSGTDTRSGRAGRKKTIWGWNADEGELRRRSMEVAP